MRVDVLEGGEESGRHRQCDQDQAHPEAEQRRESEGLPGAAAAGRSPMRSVDAKALPVRIPPAMAEEERADHGECHSPGPRPGTQVEVYDVAAPSDAEDGEREHDQVDHREQAPLGCADAQRALVVRESRSPRRRSRRSSAASPRECRCAATGRRTSAAMARRADIRPRRRRRQARGGCPLPAAPRASACAGRARPSQAARSPTAATRYNDQYWV